MITQGHKDLPGGRGPEEIQLACLESDSEGAMVVWTMPQSRAHDGVSERLTVRAFIQTAMWG